MSPAHTVMASPSLRKDGPFGMFCFSVWTNKKALLFQPGEMLLATPPPPQCGTCWESVLEMTVREREDKWAGIHALHSQTQKYIKLTIILGNKCGPENTEDVRFSSPPNKWLEEQEI